MAVCSNFEHNVIGKTADEGGSGAQKIINVGKKWCGSKYRGLRNTSSDCK